MQRAALILAIVLLSGCGQLICDESSERVAFARHLSPQRLAKLYSDTQRLFGRPHPRVRAGSYPHEFDDLELEDLREGGGTAQYTLAHCMDHAVVLQVPVGGVRRVTLYWGEGPSEGEQVLWRGLAP